jgi:spore photoproduct lyase
MPKVKKIDYQIKFDSFKNNTLFKNFNLTQQKFVEQISFRYHFTFQEFRQVVEAVSDFNMWQETDFEKWWVSKSNQNDISGNNNKKQMLGDLYKYLDDLRSQPTKYPEHGLVKPIKRKTKKVVTKKSDKAIYGMCPVASPKTVCCNLRTIDAVENCSFGCSYCTIQTFYTDNAIFDAELEKKLSEIKLEKNRFYHFGSGQSSDSLAWGNREGNLEILCNFAKNNPHEVI